MNCKKCGFPIAEGDQFCKNCGEAVGSQNNNFNNSQPPVGGYTQDQGYPNSTMGVQSNGQLASQGYNNAQTQPSKNGLKIIIIAVSFILVSAISVLATFLLVGQKNEEVDPVVEKPVVQEQKQNNYKVSYKNFNFEIPDNYIYQTDDEGLLIGDEEGTWSARLDVSEGSFAQLKANKEQIQTYFQEQGVEVSAIEEKTVGDNEGIVIAASYEGVNEVLAYVKLNSMYLAWIEVVNLDNEYDYEILEEIGKIVSSAKLSESTTNIMPMQKFELEKILELAKE